MVCSTPYKITAYCAPLVCSMPIEYPSESVDNSHPRYGSEKKL